jgi:hypothetical protein
LISSSHFFLYQKETQETKFIGFKSVTTWYKKNCGSFEMRSTLGRNLLAVWIRRPFKTSRARKNYFYGFNVYTHVTSQIQTISVCQKLGQSD